MPHYVTGVLCRIETKGVVTASNLFKYCGPEHGLLLFKRHNPLQFTASEVAELLHCASQWFTSAAIPHIHTGLGASSSAVSRLAASTASGGGCSALFPLLLWNCMPRAGASQFHGHAQVAMSQVS